jgi:hypothetical protein
MVNSSFIASNERGYVAAMQTGGFKSASKPNVSYWPTATCGLERVVGRFRGIADLARPATGSAQ